MSLRLITKMAGGASFEKMKGVIDHVHERTGKNKASIFLDILNCSARYGAGYYDYQIFEFYNMTAKQRATYVTRVKNKKLILRLNNQDYSYIFDEKNVFDKRFAKYLGRQVLDLKGLSFHEFEAFVRGREYFFAKPYIGESGKGIEKIKVSSFHDLDELYAYVTSREKNFGVIEEVIRQHEAAARIYPDSLNCLRIGTIVEQGVPHILYSVFKMGNNGKFVDNLENGGLACHFDLDKGKITGQGHTSKLVNYDKHPYTGIRFIGYSLPFMKEVKEMVLQAALEVPQMRYVGWDVCLTENGPAIVEGNDYPGYDFPQLPDPDKPKIGLLPKIQEILPDFK